MRFQPLFVVTLTLVFLFPPNFLNAEDPSEEDEKRTFKKIVSYMTTDLGDKIIVYIPAIKTDPNRGLTAGIMPVIVGKDPNSSGIKKLHAPSLTYNRFFKWNATWRYYYYPSDGELLFLRGAYAQETNRKVTARYKNARFMNSVYFVDARFDYFRDGSRRFFGFGPNSDENNQSNYTLDSLRGKVRAGAFLTDTMKFEFGFRAHHDKVSNGPVNTISDIDVVFPGLSFDDRKTFLPLRYGVVYDSRDNDNTPKRGIFFNLYGEAASGSLGSDITYEGVGGEVRVFIPNTEESLIVTAGRLLFEQQYGTELPFYLQSQLGGKESLRGFGAGRFVDRGRMALTVEQRVQFMRVTLMDVLTEFEVSPFFEIGSVFNKPRKIQIKDLEPVVGVALRAVVRPHIVGSIDFGLGTEGIATFVNIDYPF